MSSHVSDPDARPILEAFQREPTDTLDAYFHNTAVITPTVDQLEVLTKKAEVLSMFQGIVDPNDLDTQGRFLITQTLGRTHPGVSPRVCVREKGVHTMDAPGVSS